MSPPSAKQREHIRQLFAQESASRLDALAGRLLELEQLGEDAELLQEIFREAHTLKGSAAVVGFKNVAEVAHAVEDLLEELRGGRLRATPELIDGVLHVVDGLRSMIPRVMDGHDCAPEAADLVRGILALAAEGTGALVDRAAGPAAEPVAAPAPTPAPAPEPGPGATPEAAAPEPAGVAQRRTAAAAGGWSETVRVPVERLDRFVAGVGETATAHLRLAGALAERLGPAGLELEELHALARSVQELQSAAMRARMVPVATITAPLQRAVRDLSRSLGKQAIWDETGTDTELDRNVLEQLADPLLHLVRNAVDHGLEPPDERSAAGKSRSGLVRLHARQLGAEVVVSIADDGRGIDAGRVSAAARARGVELDADRDEEAAALEAIFGSGLSTAERVSDVSGRGVGLDVVRANIQALRGRVEVDSRPGLGTEFRVIVPITLAVLRCLLVRAGGRPYALPMHSVDLVTESRSASSTRAGGRTVMWLEDDPVPLTSLAEALGGPAGGVDDDPVGGPVAVVSSLAGRWGFRVAALDGQRDLVVKGLGQLLPTIDVLAGASVEPDGSVLLVLDAAGLVERARTSRSRLEVRAEAAPPAAPPSASVLVVDDALPVRELERSILERAGYEVRTAGDGVEALALLAERPADLVISDIEMPRMDGFALTEAIRAEAGIRNVAVLLLTNRASEEDRHRGLAAGADGYLIKSDFDEGALLGAVGRLLGSDHTPEPPAPHAPGRPFGMRSGPAP